MALLKKLMAKQKADATRVAEQAAKRRAARIARKVARVAEEAQNGLDDLPLEVAVAIEANSAQPIQAVNAQPDDTVENLVARLEAIRERIWRLQAMFAVTLSHDCAMEADRFLALFQSLLAQQLKAKDVGAFDSLVRGHEALLLSPPVQTKPTIRLDTQRLCELRWEAATQPVRRAPKPPAHPDGLSWMV
jgi:hypothetical protein